MAATITPASLKSLLEGNDFGRWVAVIVASIGILRWFYWMPFAPFLALTIIAIFFLVLSILLVWGGFTVSVLYLSRRPDRHDFPPGGEDDHREDIAPVERDT